MDRRMPFGWKLLVATVPLGMALLVAGCHGTNVSQAPQASIQPAGKSAGLTAPRLVSTVRAVCDPPVGWAAEPLKSSSHHAHQVWLSPSGATAYGVIHFGLPWPVGDALALR